MQSTSRAGEDSTEALRRASRRDPDIFPRIEEFLSDSQGTISAFQTRRRRRFEHFRVAMFVTCVIVSIVAGTILAALLRQRQTSAASTAAARFLCTTDDCQKQSAILAAVDTSIDPCHDFGAFVCSAWRNDVDYVYSTRTDMEARFLLKLSDTLRRIESNVSAVQKAAKAFKSCVENRIDGKRNFAVLKSFLRDRNVLWPDAPSKDVHPLDVLLDLSINWRVSVWFRTTVLPIRENLPKRIFVSQTASIGYYSQIRKKIVAAKWRRRYWERYLDMFNVSRSDKDRDRLFDVGEAVQELLGATFQMTKKRHIVFKIAEMSGVTSTLSPSLWLSTLNKHLYPPLTLHMDDEVVFDNHQFPVTIDRIMSNFSREDVMDNIGWMAVQMLGWLGHSEAQVLQFGSAEESRSLAPILCVVDVEEIFLPIVYAAYENYTFPPKDMNRVDAVIDGVLRRAATKLDESTWIDMFSRAEAKKKVADMARNVWLDVDLLRDGRQLEAFDNFSNFDDIYIDSWITTRRALRSLLGNPEFESLLQFPVSFTSEQMFYAYFTNTLNVVPASFTAPLYYKNGTVAMRYGGLGAFVAAEVVKAFDALGTTIGSELTHRWWWSDKSLSAYTTRANCNGLDVFPWLPALEIAFDEYREIIEGDLKSDEGYRLVRSETNSADQVFFFAFCFYLCKATTNARFAPECNEALRHFEPFADAFRCRTATPMNPGKSCKFFD